MVVAGSEFLGADEAERERLREMTSPVTVAAAANEWSQPLQRAFVAAAKVAPGAPVDRVELRWKAVPPRAVLSLGKPGGGEDRALVFDARSRRTDRTDRLQRQAVAPPAAQR